MVGAGCTDIKVELSGYRRGLNFNVVEHDHDAASRLEMRGY